MSDSEDDVSLASESDASRKEAGASSSGTDLSPGQPVRDEVEEIEKASKTETNWIRAWRVLLVAVLGATAFSVTFVTYRFLADEQVDSYKNSFGKFSETIRTAALQHQLDVIHGLSALGDSLTASAQTANAEWPFYNHPFFEKYASHALEETGAEAMTVVNVVSHAQRAAYEKWTTENYYSMVSEAHMLKNGNLDSLPSNATFSPYILQLSPSGNIPDIERESYLTMWNWSPPPYTLGIVNWNVASIPDYKNAINAAMSLNDVTWTRIRPYLSAGVSMSKEQHDALHSQRKGSKADHPHAFVNYPVCERMNDPNSPVVAAIAAGMALDVALRNLLPEKVSGIHAIISNSCNQSYTYLLDGPDALYIGEGDLHDKKYARDGVEIDLGLGTNPEFRSTTGHCIYKLTVYPTRQFEESFDSNTPELFAGVVAAAFCLLGGIFLLYDIFVEKRNRKLISNAARSNAIVTSLFPGKMRDQVLGAQDDKQNRSKSSTKANLKSFVAGGHDEAGLEGSKPLAELFLETTVLFADIVGFTAWSSTREPAQVFSLLESLFKEFDHIAQRRRIFKVETVGDCYVAAAGIPEYRRDHAVVMMRFAREILKAMDTVTKRLEVSLGPDTGDLALRIGVHSGPVTAGVLRGDRARFQLFGDTMNTTARLESTGKPGFVHLSKATADLLARAGKSTWVEARKDIVVAKGKGKLETFFLKQHFMRSDSRSVASGTSSESDASQNDPAEPSDQEHREVDERTQRLISWNVETLLALLKQIISHRDAMKAAGKYGTPLTEEDVKVHGEGVVTDCLGEVQEIISLPEYDHSIAALRKDPDGVHISADVKEELRVFVDCVASMYRDNPFHCFEHASHVLMSVTKLMSRIIAPAELENYDDNAQLHDHTYGITSDPLTLFSCALSALIHDVDHQGVPNTTLVEEKVPIASAYKNRSVAEQNSLDLSWSLLMDEQFKHLRQSICETREEFQRFRSLVVNSIMATDICDKELKMLRNARWQRAFSESGDEQGKQVNEIDAVNRKATIVIEHLIQASDVSHTMQHWHVYRKWNERLFREMVVAYQMGRSQTHPAEFWYKGEIGFFDFYIIPLAKKLKDCGVFGISSDEYLNYAIHNRHEWEDRGQEVVNEMMAQLEQEERHAVAM